MAKKDNLQKVDEEDEFDEAEVKTKGDPICECDF